MHCNAVVSCEGVGCGLQRVKAVINTTSETDGSGRCKPKSVEPAWLRMSVESKSQEKRTGQRW